MQSGGVVVVVGFDLRAGISDYGGEFGYRPHAVVCTFQPAAAQLPPSSWDATGASLANDSRLLLTSRDSRGAVGFLARLSLDR